nr:MAG TPA: hypothetical protein [Caudoviricetes sp.]
MWRPFKCIICVDEEKPPTYGGRCKVNLLKRPFKQVSL